VYFLLGNYLSAATLWQDRAIPRVRFDRSTRALTAAGSLTRGDTVNATDAFLALPATLNQQATWEYDLAMCQLEAGTPDEAAEHLKTALSPAADLAVRPIAASYLEKPGKPVPPLPKTGQRTAMPAGPASGPTDKPSLPPRAATDRPQPLPIPRFLTKP